MALPTFPLRAAGLLLLAHAAGGAAPPPQDAAGPGASTKPILDVMESLESSRDAKCHSTACRFENYVFGTPLTDGARGAKVELQKELVEILWRAASEAARGAGRESVGAADVEAEVARFFELEESFLGDLSVRFLTVPGKEPLEISNIRKQQYASIAYSLRTILAVQQDYLLEGGAWLGELDESAVQGLKDALDVVTLCALSDADEAARADSRAEITAESFRAAWRGLLPEKALGFDLGGPLQVPDAASREQALAILRGIIAEKTAAYEDYNDLDQSAARARFLVNVERFYALHQLPAEKQDVVDVLATFDNAVVSFALQLLQVSAGFAERAGHALIRSDDAVSAVHLLTPHEVDTLEDVHFFPRLDPRQQVTLEAYDCDSFRDLGMHWRLVERALDAEGSPAITPDPFAAEILAESVSQYAVLVWRVAGDVAKSRGKHPSLRPVDVQRAVQRIVRRGELNRSAPERERSAAGIASAPTRTTAAEAAPGGGFFSDVTEESGIDFLHRSSPWLSEFRRERTSGPPTFSGGGVAAEDLDGDGDPDLLFAGGIGLGLYENDGAGGFRDVTRTAGLLWLREDGTTGEARTPLLVDLDNDGLADVVVTYANDAHRVFRNRGGLEFEDVTKRAALGGAGRIGGPATACDLDGDGLLDLYVTYFGNYLEGAIPTVDRDNRNGLPNRLFRNRGDFRFEDVSTGSGTDDSGWCQAVSHADLDRDGRQDLIVANDFGRNVVLRNLGGMRFENIAPRLGLTNAFHSMNVGIADLNADDHPDVYISNIATLVKDNKYVLPDVYTPLDFDYESMATMLVKESDVLYLSQVEEGELIALEPSSDVERGATSTGWAWDAEFLDVDHDGDDDLYVVNGTNDYNYYSSVHRSRTSEGVTHRFLSHARESNVFFENDGGKLLNRSQGSGADLLLNSRSTAYLDADADGDLDIALNNFHSPAVLLRNDAPRQGAWLAVRLVGDPEQGSNRDAIGARVVATTDAGLRVVREVQGGSGYLSMNAKTCHFGLGGATEVDLRIEWPNGEVETLEGVSVGRTLTVRQAN